MSFLNPVSEPVLRFSSTDADAPQINYAARTAGDVKTVLKACLVTGYGAKASAGWSVVNEIDHVAEFVSPSAAMSDYRLGMDDSSASSTVFYYFANNVRQNIDGTGLNKVTNAIMTTDSRNAWELLVSARGLIWIENVVIKSTGLIGSSVTYWGQLKTDKETQSGKNIAFWSIGYNSPAINQGSPTDFFSSTSGAGKKYVLSDMAIDGHAHVALPILSKSDTRIQVTTIELFADWFLIANKSVVAKQPAVALGLRLSSDGAPATGIGSIDGRPALKVWPVRGASSSTAAFVYNYSPAVIALYLDNWEY